MRRIWKNRLTNTSGSVSRSKRVYEDWAMMRDAKGFGIALLPPESKHPPHIGMRVETLEELEKAAAKRKSSAKSASRQNRLRFTQKALTAMRSS